MEELDLKELFILFWNKKIQIILIVAIFLAIGIIYTIGFVTPVYTSKTKLVLATSDNSSSQANTITTTDITLNSNLVSTYSELVGSKKVIKQVIANLGIDASEDAIRKNVTVSSVKNSQLIEIAVVNESPIYAAKIANEIAKVFSEEVTEIYNINNLHVVDEAEVNEVPSNINHMKDIIILVFIGIVVSIAYVLIANMLDTTIKTAEEVEKLFNVPVLATIPIYSVDMEKGGKKK